MNEAERRDRISLMDSGRVLATDTPANLVRARGVNTLEEAFIAYLLKATSSRTSETMDIAVAGKTIVPVLQPPPQQRAFSQFQKRFQQREQRER